MIEEARDAVGAPGTAPWKCGRDGPREEPDVQRPKWVGGRAEATGRGRSRLWSPDLEAALHPEGKSSP